jgi:hypothetical protein
VPKGFRRIGHYGFLAKGGRNARLERVRTLLAARSGDQPSQGPTSPASADEHAAAPNGVFAVCRGAAALCVVVGPVAPVDADPFRCDTS